VAREGGSWAWGVSDILSQRPGLPFAIRNMATQENPASSNPSAKNPGLQMEELLGRVAGRDADALGSLFDQFAPKLLGLLLRILSSQSEAESALQEVFVRLWKEAPSLSQIKGSVAAWLVVVARYEGFRRLRSRRARAARLERRPNGQSHEKQPKQAQKPGEAARRERDPRERTTGQEESQHWAFLAATPQLWVPQPHEVASVDARLGLLQRAFNQMPKPQRHALELAVFDAYNASEIAGQLGEPLGKVNAELRAAFTFLRHRQHAVLGTWTADI